MLSNPTIETLQILKLHGLLEALEEQQQTPAVQPLSFEERIALLVDRERRRTCSLPAPPAPAKLGSPAPSLSKHVAKATIRILLASFTEPESLAPSVYIEGKLTVS